MRIYEIENNGEIFEYVEIQLGENHFTSMLKSTYDEMIAAQSTPSVE
jgi:hypothetical protein